MTAFALGFFIGGALFYLRSIVREHWLRERLMANDWHHEIGD